LRYIELTKALHLESKDAKKIDSGRFSYEKLPKASPVRPPRVKKNR